MGRNGRRATAAALLGLTGLDPSLAAAEELSVHKTSGCGCCIGWIRHMEANGFSVKPENVPMGSLM